VIACQQGDRAIGDTLNQLVNVLLLAKRRVHFEIGIERADAFIRKRDVVRTDFGRDRNAASARIA
jgi:hypothetical protein